MPKQLLFHDEGRAALLRGVNVISHAVKVTLGRAASVTVGGTEIMAQARPTTLRPLHDRVLVRRIEDGPARRGAIIIPDSAKEKPQEGKVIAVGKGRVSEAGKKTPLDVKAGDRVLFGKYSGSEVKVNGEELLIMKEEDVLAILGS